MITTNQANSPRPFKEIFKSFLHPRVITMLFFGFSAGLPLLLIFSSLSLWLREAEVSRATVTFFSWAALGYSFKFVWAPLVDRLPIPFLTNFLGRRRSWLLLAQCCVIASLVFMASNDPQHNLTLTALGAVMLGFSGATQDIVIDAYRIETAETDYQSLMSSAYIAGYRIGMILAGAGALKLADWFAANEIGYQFQAWSTAYLCMAGAMSIGIMTTLLASEPTGNNDNYRRPLFDYVRFVFLFAFAVSAFIGGFFITSNLNTMLGITNSSVFMSAMFEVLRLFLCLALAVFVGVFFLKIHLVPKSMIQEAYIDPFTDFFDRYGKFALFLIVFISIYRISDIVMGAVSNVFYDDMGYSKDQIAFISKTFGLVLTILGGFVGGVCSLRYGVMKTLWYGALLTAVTNILFAILAIRPPETYILATIIAADNFSGGLAGAAFIAFMSGLTSQKFTAVQYAIFSSLMTLFPKVLAGYSGTIVNVVGYESFFIGAGLLGLPVLWLVSRVSKKVKLSNND